MSHFKHQKQGRIPAPPGGHRLRINPRQRPHQRLRVVREVSAGGVVISQHDGVYRAAVIARRNRGGRLEWCLPKGHVEQGETLPITAVREISEETGISGEVIEHLGTIEYWFNGRDRRVNKTVHHFLLRSLGGFLTVENDPDHEAEDVAWMDLVQLEKNLAYANERRLVNLAWERFSVRS